MGYRFFATIQPPKQKLPHLLFAGDRPQGRPGGPGQTKLFPGYSTQPAGAVEQADPTIHTFSPRDERAT